MKQKENQYIFEERDKVKVKMQILKKGLQQNDVARELAISKMQLSNILNGRRSINEEMLKKLEQIVSLDEKNIYKECVDTLKEIGLKIDLQTKTLYFDGKRYSVQLVALPEKKFEKIKVLGE